MIITEQIRPIGALLGKSADRGKTVKGRVELEDLRKIYVTRLRHGLWRSEEKSVEALSGISLEIEPGEIFGLLGPNGAGKTTLIKCLTTLLVPSAGRALINGFRLGAEDNRIRATIGCMLMGERGLYWKLTGRENLIFFGALYHLDPAARRGRSDEIIEQLDLGEIADRPVETYSSGQKMKLAFGKALINDAPLVVLDEPTNTLDVPSARELRRAVRELSRGGKTVIYTTHIMSEAESLCDRVAIIDRGRVLALGTVAQLKASLVTDQVIRIDGVIPAPATEAVRRLPGVRKIATAAVDGQTRLTVVAGGRRSLLPRLIDELTRHDSLMQKITPQEVTLEDVFISHTGRTLVEDTRSVP